MAKEAVHPLAILLAGKVKKDQEEGGYEGSPKDDDAEGEMYLRGVFDALGIHVHADKIKEACEALDQWHQWAHRDMEAEGQEDEGDQEAE